MLLMGRCCFDGGGAGKIIASLPLRGALHLERQTCCAVLLAAGHHRPAADLCCLPLTERIALGAAQRRPIPFQTRLPEAGPARGQVRRPHQLTAHCAAAAKALAGPAEMFAGDQQALVAAWPPPGP